MANSDDLRSKAEANNQLLAEQAPLVAILNGLMDEALPWQACFGNADYVDLFGDHIPEGRRHYRQGDPGSSPARLSAASMAGVLKVILSTKLTVRLAGAQLAERARQLRVLAEGVPRDGV